ncbi:helix-turn-helix transcriptional regulator [Nocardia aurea]|uniref:AraC family transcriptional regulator n=1 Tax=Nocardia aurea TaxID=2144174 RepID=A0ABV3G266_9NOCA
MDVLSETVAAIRTGNPASGMFVRHAPWGREYPVVPGAGFHVVLEGSCYLIPPAGVTVASLRNVSESPIGTGTLETSPVGAANRAGARASRIGSRPSSVGPAAFGAEQGSTTSGTASGSAASGTAPVSSAPGVVTHSNRLLPESPRRPAGMPTAGVPLALATGDVLFMPRGADHYLVDDLGSPVTEVAIPGEPRYIPGSGAKTALLCGAYGLGRQRSHPLLDELPEFIHLPADSRRDPALRGAVDLLAAEMTEPRLGSDAVVPALLEMLLLFALRSWFDQQATEHATGWAAAFADPAVAVALRAVHEEPARAWTVSDLSDIAGVSRATLARRFAATIGEPPLAYVTRWRMLTAARLLRDTDAALSAIARKVGYTSEFAFAKAFKREYGLAPGRYRHTTDETPLIAV